MALSLLVCFLNHHRAEIFQALLRAFLAFDIKVVEEGENYGGFRDEGRLLLPLLLG